MEEELQGETSAISPREVAQANQRKYFALILKTRMKEFGYSQQQLSDRLKDRGLSIHRNIIAKWLSAEKVPGRYWYRILEALSSILSLPVEVWICPLDEWGRPLPSVLAQADHAVPKDHWEGVQMDSKKATKKGFPNT